MKRPIGATPRFVAAVLGIFTPVYLLTRSSILVGDSEGYIEIARAGNPSHIFFGDPSHFLQIPMASAVWRECQRLGVAIPLEDIFLALSVAGTLAAVVFVGLIAWEVLRRESVAWFAAILLGGSLTIWTQLNGELYGLALGLFTAAVFFCLRGHTVATALLWALAVLSHSDFVLGAPVLAVSVWMSAAPGIEPKRRILEIVALLALAAASALFLLLSLSWAIGKWSDLPSLMRWLPESYTARQSRDIAAVEAPRALKGLVTAFTVAGHYWRDVLTGRGDYSDPFFVLVSAIGLVVIAATGVLILGGLSNGRLALFALAWLLPFHVLLNWSFNSTVEKYHAGALPALVLLVVGGLNRFVTGGDRRRYVLCGAYVVLVLTLNLFGAILPMRALGIATSYATAELRQLNQQESQHAVLVTCDGGNVRAVREAGLEYLRIRSIWSGSVDDIEQTILSWVKARIGEGKKPYVLERRCFPEEWQTDASRKPFDLSFLSREFRLAPTSIVRVPVDQPLPADPFTWRTADVFRVDSTPGPSTRN